MHVHDGTERELPWKVNSAPEHYSVRNIGRQDACNVRPDHRLLKGHEDIGHRVQVSARAAPNIGNIQVRRSYRTEPQSSFDLVIGSFPSTEEAEQTIRPRGILQRI